jgi:hypothetical protein
MIATFYTTSPKLWMMATFGFKQKFFQKSGAQSLNIAQYNHLIR